jgi:uncharacterized repeat protein (TIGR02543 family)
MTLGQMSLDYTIQNRGKITFQGDGITTTTTTYNEGQRPSRSVSRDGYRLVGWSNGGTTYAPDQVPLVTQYDVTYTAIWEKIYYNITWNYNGGTCNTAVLTNPTSHAALDTSWNDGGKRIPSKPGYVFTGWQFSPSNPITQDGYKGYTSDKGPFITT